MLRGSTPKFFNVCPCVLFHAAHCVACSLRRRDLVCRRSATGRTFPRCDSSICVRAALGQSLRARARTATTPRERDTDAESTKFKKHERTVQRADRGTMSALQSDPSMLPRMQIDKGGIRFIMVRSERTAVGNIHNYLSPTQRSDASAASVQNGADVMCPGLTSAGAEMADAEAGDVVVRKLCACLPTDLLSAGS